MTTLKAFRVDLKACLGLTNTAPLLSGKIKAGFQMILLCGPRVLLGCPYYEPLLQFMIHVLVYKKLGIFNQSSRSIKISWSSTQSYKPQHQIVIFLLCLNTISQRKQGYNNFNCLSYCDLYDYALLQLVSILFLLYYQLKIPNLFVYQFVTFLQTIMLSDEPMHSASNGSNSAACPSYINNHLKVKYPLHIFDSCVQPKYKSRTVRKAPLLLQYPL